MVQAVGIPDRFNFGDISALKPGRIYTFVLQRHFADKAGEHYDMRIGDKDIGLLSWAIPKARLPDFKEKLLAEYQPVHDYQYKDFEGRIEEGYGKGDVRLEKQGAVLITENTGDKLSFTVLTDRYPVRYTLIKPQTLEHKDKSWLLLNSTPSDIFDYTKYHMKFISPEKVEDYIKRGYYVSPKVDGAHAIIIINDGNLEVYSYRISRVQGLPILHTERIFKGRIKDLPKSLNGTILKGEIYGTQNINGKEVVIPPTKLSAILNSNPFNALKLMQDENIKLKIGIFDIHKYKNSVIDPNVSSLKERLGLIKEVINSLPKDISKNYFQILPFEKADKAFLLWDQIKNKQYPLTYEGVVIYPEKGNPIKSKLRKEADVYIRELYPGEGKYATVLGAIGYSRTPKGPIVGRVGTGLDDALREEIFKNQNDYIGRKIRVAYQEEFPTGAFRAPVFISLHEDFPNKEEKLGSFNFYDDCWLEVPEKFMTKTAISPLELTSGISKGKTFLESLMLGPTPLTSMAVDAALGYFTLWGIGKALEKLFPKTFTEKTPDKLGRIGAVLSLLPPGILHLLPNIKEYGISGLFKPSAIQKSVMESLKSGSELSNKLVEDLMLVKIANIDWINKPVKLAFNELNSKFDAHDWSSLVLQLDKLDPWEKMITTTPALAASVVKDNPVVTVADVARTTANMGLGALYGKILGKLATPVLGLSEESMKSIVESGKLAGALKSLVSPLKEVIENVAIS